MALRPAASEALRLQDLAVRSLQESLGTAVVIRYEEKDLVKRFGDAYLECRQRTGALIPKFWKKKRKRAFA
jgi:hypothetical protein